MKNICFFSGDITRSGGTERVGSVVANELAKNEEFNICFLSLWEKQENSFFDIAQNIDGGTKYLKKMIVSVNTFYHLLLFNIISSS